MQLFITNFVIIKKLLLNMTFTPDQIKSLSNQEKIELIGLLWDELTSNSSKVEIPEGHQQILKKRIKKLNEGKTTFKSWNQIRKKYLQ
jgi:putative addiction module component (TIGR02574 family)